MCIVCQKENILFMVGSQFQSFLRGVMNRGKLKYRCKGCTGTPRGCDLKRHYKNSVNWPLVKLLKAANGTELQELRDGADRHSLFIFDRGYSSENLLSYQNHVLAKEANVVLEEEEEDQDEAGPSCAVTARGQRGIASFFQVTLEQACCAGCRRRPFPMQLHH